MKIRNWQNFWSGIMFFVIGLGFSIGATRYDMGEAARMGPGYFPFWLGAVLAVMGSAICMTSLSKRSDSVPVEGIDWRVVLFVLGSVILVGLVFDFVGVIVAVGLLVVLSSLASHVFSWRVSVLNAIVMAGIVWLVFVKGLGIVFPSPSLFAGS